MLAKIRYLRHGRLKKFTPFWLVAGRTYRSFINTFNIAVPVLQKIGEYGPFKIHPNFAFSNFSNWGNKHNRGFKKCIEMCKNKTCVLDIGAHIGLVTIPASDALAPGGKVYAFEPADANLRFLEYHIEKNNISNVVISDLLVGEKNQQQVEFFQLNDATGMNSILNPVNKGNFTKTYKQQITLDSFCKEHNLLPEVIKIDVEGAELAVLQGAKETIIKAKPVIFLSIHPTHIKKLGFDINSLDDILCSLNYEAKDMDGNTITEYKLDEYILTPKL